MRFPGFLPDPHPGSILARNEDGRADSRRDVAPLRLAWIVSALLIAVALVALVDRATGTMPPRWDAADYTAMARRGVIGNDSLVAPFAYRPAVPLLAGAVSRIFATPVDAAFQGIARTAVVCLLWITFLLAYSITRSGARSLIPMVFVAASIMPVKFALFFPTLVDAAAYPLMILAVWAFLSGRPAWSFGISAAGLFFKEFLAIPLLLAVAALFQVSRKRRTRRSQAIFVGAAVVALAVILVPRLMLPIVETRQEIDPTHNLHSLSRLVMNPLNFARDLNILLSLLAFWLPALLLATPGRFRAVARVLKPWRAYLTAFLALDLLLALYGGTNLLTFVSYALPVLIAVLAILAAPAGAPNLGEKERPRIGEWLLALACVVSYGRVFGTIPDPGNGLGAYLDYYSGWSDRVNLSTLRRFLEIALYLGVMHLFRVLLHRSGIPRNPR